MTLPHQTRSGNAILAGKLGALGLLPRNSLSSFRESRVRTVWHALSSFVA